MSSNNDNWIGRKPDANDPKLLFKYCQFDQYKIDLLDKGELYFPSPSQLNDPFDCRVSPSFSEATDSEMLRYIDLMNEKELLGLSRFKKQLKRRELLAQFKKDWTNASFREHHIKRRYLGIDDYVGILSFSKNYKSNALWGHYGDSNRGFLVVFDFKELFESLHKQFTRFSLGTGLFYGSADYSGYPTNIKPIQEKSPEYLGSYFKKLYSYKSPVWEFENEYRIISYPTYERIISFDTKCIKEVVIGVNMPEPQIQKMKKICKGKYTLKKSELIEESFDLEYSIIQKH